MSEDDAEDVSEGMSENDDDDVDDDVDDVDDDVDDDEGEEGEGGHQREKSNNPNLKGGEYTQLMLSMRICL